MASRRGSSVFAFTGKAKTGVHATARELIGASMSQRAKREEALISAALAEGFDRARMQKTPDLKLEWTMLASCALYAEIPARLLQQEERFGLLINECDEFFLPYTKYAMEVARAIIELH